MNLGTETLTDQKAENDVLNDPNLRPSIPNSSIITTSSQAEISTENALLEENRSSPSEAPSSTPQTSRINNLQICVYFKNGYCKFGNQCRFSHQQENRPRKNVNTSLKNDRPLCQFYQRFGYCKYGRSCRYIHYVPARQRRDFYRRKRAPVSKEAASQDKTQSYSEVPKSGEYEAQSEEPAVTEADPEPSKDLNMRNREPNSGGPRRTVVTRASKPRTVDEMRSTEITQFKRRFPQSVKLDSLDESADTFKFIFSPTDPDWPFDVREIDLEITFPKEYPQEIFLLTVLEENERMPSVLIRHLNKEVKTWIDEKHSQNSNTGKFQMILRPFLKWLDRNLQKMFIEGLKKAQKIQLAEAAGIEFVPFEHLSIVANKDEDSSEDQEAFSLNEEPASNIQQAEDDNCTSEIEREETRQSISNIFPAKHGTEVKFRSLDMSDNVATLSCQKIMVIIQCQRCKTNGEVTTPANRSNLVICSKCNQQQYLTFHPSLMHQFSAVLGYLDLKECRVIDVPIMNCVFQVECLKCQKKMSADGIHYGQKRQMWCQSCNEKMSLFVEAVKFQQHAVKAVDTQQANLVKLTKINKKVKDPAIQEGKPLPDNGICKHYKKSFRWLRFPCCGKAYPCDKCHDENELDHEMKFASRMICGFCGKEQPYAPEKQCILCSAFMTKKSTAHWEGGKGCRDRVKMSKDDPHKFIGSNKTVSKKAQGKPKPTKK